jgi:DNA-binding transcriptional ArsR family regulator
MAEMTMRLEDLLDDYRSRVETRGRSITALVIEDLPRHPIVDTPSVSMRYEVTPQSAHSALLRLAEAGIVEERPLARRRKGRPRRVFAARELIDVLGSQ